MKLLLTGAGFSRNWGGWLANEAFEYLLGCPDVDDELRKLLWEDKLKGHGFEDTLAELQQRVKTYGRSADQAMLAALDASLAGMFNEMNQGLASATFEQTNDANYQVAGFLTKFDAIFTLNQDLLLEYHYRDNPIAFAASGPSGWQAAGVHPFGPQHAGFDPTPQRARMYTPDTNGFGVPAGQQPYFKLHGSSNFLRDPGGRILVMGGNKAVSINQEPLLKWCHEQFVARLNQADKLMVIGYGFGDAHINDAIAVACQGGRLKLFIVDPQGVDVLDRNKTMAIKVRDPLIEQLGPHIVGGSRRTLLSTFGGDRVEYGKLIRFVDK